MKLEVAKCDFKLWSKFRNYFHFLKNKAKKLLFIFFFCRKEETRKPSTASVTWLPKFLYYDLLSNRTH